MSYKELEDIIDAKIKKAIRKHEMIVAFISSIIGLIFIAGLFHAILLNQTQIQALHLN
jgi:energy-converting hydrogenase Eha subunit F